MAYSGIGKYPGCDGDRFGTNEGQGARVAGGSTVTIVLLGTLSQR